MSLGIDRICVIIGRTRHKMVVIELEEAVKRGAKFIELRLDFLAKAVDFQRLLPHKKCPWVATLRRREDGGRWAGSEVERKMVLRQAIVAGFDWVDLESDIANEIPRFRGVKRIVSYHNMTETPTDLGKIFEGMLKQDADVLKLAVMAQQPADILRILDIIRNSPKPVVGHCLGDIGFPSRLLALRCGAPFVYAAFNKERGLAPGLPSMEELQVNYDVPGINADTKVFGLLGDPVAHSYSPVLHNQMFKQNGINAVYLPFRVPRGELAATIKSFAQFPVQGYSVTIPHKEEAAALAVQSDLRVKETSAANTLLRQEKGFYAVNTDYDAALQSLETDLPRDEGGNPVPLQFCTALILGAGGAARAVAHALHRVGAQVYISSRTHERAEKLAHEVSGKAIDWGGRHNVTFSILVNCTPVGMHPDVDATPIHAGVLQPGLVVFDTVYNPETTLLVKQALQRGCRVITGVEMFVRQAALQFHYFTGLTANLDSLREILRRALSPLTQKSPTEPVTPPEE